MIIWYECTDCKHCGSFSGDLSITCLCPTLPAHHIHEYSSPGNKGDASNCDGFEEGEPRRFSHDDLREALDWMVEIPGSCCHGLRKWIEERGAGQK